MINDARDNWKFRIPEQKRTQTQKVFRGREFFNFSPVHFGDGINESIDLAGLSEKWIIHNWNYDRVQNPSKVNNKSLTY